VVAQLKAAAAAAAGLLVLLTQEVLILAGISSVTVVATGVITEPHLITITDLGALVLAAIQVRGVVLEAIMAMVWLNQ
jgi:hypothetical protein